MPRFFFDVMNGESFSPDDEGMDCPDQGSARREAQRAISEIVRDAMPDGSEHVVVIRVRDEGGRPALMVSNVTTVVQME